MRPVGETAVSWGVAGLVWTWVAGHWGPSARLFSLWTWDYILEVVAGELCSPPQW